MVSQALAAWSQAWRTLSAAAADSANWVLRPVARSRAARVARVRSMVAQLWLMTVQYAAVCRNDSMVRLGDHGASGMAARAVSRTRSAVSMVPWQSVRTGSPPSGRWRGASALTGMA